MESKHIPGVEKKSKPGKEYLLYQEHTSSIIVGLIPSQSQMERGVGGGLDEMEDSLGLEGGGDFLAFSI